ncbi:tRNA (guanosine(46)-N7)-methyltransferase TrmB [Niabella sp. CC-SYL272]|uniref:tRNA (guanosine(46)-N7)-methyltransferase TrmB n=1 Tax=Niabella agricola TaxID=2891571 RepID=UPI001F4284F6|nr:tRNA (guanosine(46)-N7)-methyltransferase TrmB [Niabella agricola]MCF3110737.1 tRNA (guanosine(46)-N7)-methyltransferase TrmB [Niabella agricola]
MAQKKLVRFAELNTFNNVLQFPQDMRGKWKAYFKNEQPLTLELACGKGEYALGLGRLHPNRNFVGVDIKGNRLWAGAKKAIRENLDNVAFLRVQIEQLHQYFAPGEVSEIWITFPDPQLRFSKAKKRLTHPRFLRIYQQVLKPEGIIHLKTDSPNLHRFTREVLEMYQCPVLKDTDDLYKEADLTEELKIKTYYESLDIAESNRIHYLAFQLPRVLAGEEKDRELKEAIRYELD